MPIHVYSNKNNKQGDTIMQVYHGSPYNFSKFDLSHVRSENGTSEGVGIYFTTAKSIAQGYAENGYLYTVNLHGINKLSSKTKFPRKALRQIIKKLENIGIDILSNYGDIDYSGFETVLSEAVNNIYESCDNDVDILCELYNETGEDKAVFEVFREFGYTHYIVTPEWRADIQKIVVVIDPSIITIQNVEKIDN